MAKVIIGVDLGGTRVRAARLDENLNILERHETLTLAHEGLEPTLNRIKALIHKVMPTDDSEVAGIGFSAPGPLNPVTGVVVAPPNLDGWHDVPLGDIIHEEFNVPVFIGNDANVAALAETARGASQGYRHAVYITVSTGIGGGMVIDGRLLLGTEGLAAELGHIPMIVEEGRVSTMEKEAAGPALARHAVKRIKEGATSQMLDMADGDVSKIDARIVGEAAQAGDTLAQEVVKYGGYIVGLGVVTVLHLFNPEIIVIGGGVSNVGDLLFDPMWDAIKEYSIDDDYWKDLKIVQPGLGENVSVIGAAALVVTHGGIDDLEAALKELNAAK